MHARIRVLTLALLGCGGCDLVAPYRAGSSDPVHDLGGSQEDQAAPGADTVSSADQAADGADAGSGTGDTLPADSSSSDGSSAACPTGTVKCGSACIAGTDCTQCTSAKLLCRGTRSCVTSCATCTDTNNTPLPIECYACLKNDAADNTTIATCEPNDPTKYCLNGDYSSAYKGGPGAHCDCNNTQVNACPGANQVCLFLEGPTLDWCTTCGEDTFAVTAKYTQGQTCKNNLVCDTSGSEPICR